MARRPASMAGEATQLPFDTVAPPCPNMESVAARALVVIRAWEASAERDWLDGGSWAIIQGDPHDDAAATDAEDPDYRGDVAVFDDGSRLVHGATGWAMGPHQHICPTG